MHVCVAPSFLRFRIVHALCLLTFSASPLCGTEFIRMLVCRQDTSFGQEAREAFSLMTCEEHKMGMSWLDKKSDNKNTGGDTFANHLLHLKEAQKLKKTYTEKFQVEDHMTTPLKLPYFPSVKQTLEVKEQVMRRCISRAGVTTVFDCMSKAATKCELGLSQAEVETSFRSVQSKRVETRLASYHREMDQQLAKSARPLQAQYVPGMYTGEVRSAVTLNPMFPDDANHLSDV